MNFIESLQTKNTTTENGMVTNSSTINECVNLFFTIGAMRGQDKERLLSKFSKAFNEDSLTAMKMVFWVRDIREGAGERTIFRDIMEYLSLNEPKVLVKNIQSIPEFGRWDDLEILFGTELEQDAVTLIVNGLRNGNGLCAKWVPRKGFVFNRLRKELKTSPKELRKMLVQLSNTVEQKMCSNQWSTIEYSKVPSLAMARYTNAFNKQDSERFVKYLESLKQGTTKVNASTLYPYDVVKTLKYGKWELANEQWKSLPNFMEGSNERILPVVDVSGSMNSIIAGKTTCMDVSISLGLYISERNEGAFKDAFITFSRKPELQKLNGNLQSRYHQLLKANWDMNTNLEAVFDLILNQAVKNNIEQSEMPTKILIMSDMEFDQSTRGSFTAQEMIKQKYDENGYQIPDIIYWNIQSRNENFPVRFDEMGTALISGLSPSIVKSIMGGEKMNPKKIMEKTLYSKRYKCITI